MKKVICINDCGWVTPKRFLGLEYNVRTSGPSNGDIVSVRKETDGFYFFHEWSGDSNNFNKSQFIELTEEEVAKLNKKRLASFLETEEVTTNTLSNE